MSSTYTNGDKRMKQIKLNKEDLCEFKYTVNGIKNLSHVICDYCCEDKKDTKCYLFQIYLEIKDNICKKIKRRKRNR